MPKTGAGRYELKHLKLCLVSDRERFLYENPFLYKEELGQRNSSAGTAEGSHLQTQMFDRSQTFLQRMSFAKFEP